MFLKITNDKNQITNKFQSPKHQTLAWFEIFVIEISASRYLGINQIKCMASNQSCGFSSQSMWAEAYFFKAIG